LPGPQHQLSTQRLGAWRRRLSWYQCMNIWFVKEEPLMLLSHCLNVAMARHECKEVLKGQRCSSVLSISFKHFHLLFTMHLTELLIAAGLAGSSHAFFRMSCPGRLVRERVDPIVSPGAVAGHVHTISGGSGFSQSMTFQDARASKCSSCTIKVCLDDEAVNHN
jgi:hypothetical protein